MAVDFTDLERRCRQALAELRHDAAHDAGHIQRVVANARLLAAAEGARLEIVLPAAWLHDCMVVPKDSPERARASRWAAETALRWLREWNYAEALRPEIAHAIEAHSFSAKIPPRSLEAKVVQDADRLDALGAVGLARCLMLSGSLGRPFYVLEDPFCADRLPDDRRSALDHFYTKLLGIQDTMQTASGLAAAQRRTEVLHRFITDLKQEIDFGP